ncbi:hypothetical protein [Fervidicella metallireducens]|nr:hypothetical protein [Fervidicella metallireducens]
MLLDKLIEYKSLTLDAIDALNTDDFMSLIKALDKRQECIEEIVKIDSEEDFSSVAKTLNLLQLESDLNETMRKKYDFLKKELNNISNEKRVSTVYKNTISTSIILNKKL